MADGSTIRVRKCNCSYGPFYVNDDPGAERETSHKRLTFGDSIHLICALGELLEDLFFLIVQPFLQVLFVSGYVPKQLRVCTAFLEVPLAGGGRRFRTIILQGFPSPPSFAPSAS